MATLENYNPATAGKYDPGQIVILFDHRQSGPQSSENQMSTFQSYWLDGLYRLGWPSWQTPEFEAGNLRLIWYTVRSVSLHLSTNPTCVWVFGAYNTTLKISD